MRTRTPPLAVALLTGCLLAGCGGTEPGADPATPPSTPSATSATPAPSSVAPTPKAAPAPALPQMPSLADHAELAAQLQRAAETVLDPRAGTDVVRPAALFEQLATRMLARARPRVSDDVVSRLRPAARRLVATDVRAAGELTSMTAAQPRLPEWRIVTPPPPAELLGDYRRAERLTGVPWEYLAAIHLVETRMGRIRGTSTAGAQGPMQFIPETFARYGAGGDIDSARDSILAAGRLLAANGAPDDMAGALWHYNQSSRYGRAVTAYASVMRRTPAAYRGYWHWQVLYRQRAGTFLLPEGYPKEPAERLSVS